MKVLLTFSRKVWKQVTEDKKEGIGRGSEERRTVLPALSKPKIMTLNSSFLSHSYLDQQALREGRRGNELCNMLDNARYKVIHHSRETSSLRIDPASVQVSSRLFSAGCPNARASVRCSSQG